jgi:putative endonuclease
MAFWTYMLKCSDGRYYTGHTDNLDHRIGQHQCGQGSEFTRCRLPVALAWSEAFGTRIEALEAERIVGGWSRAKKEALIAGNWSLLSHLARPPKERTNSQTLVVSGKVEKREFGAGRFSTSLETNGRGVANPDRRP